MPPLAVPSTFVTISSVNGTVSWNVLTWASAFCPMVASSTSRTLCGASGITFLMTRSILFNSSIKSVLLCNRPAVSISNKSTPASCFSTQHPASAAGSDPLARPRSRWHRCGRPRSLIAQSRRANVSPAAIITLWPEARMWCANLPMVVVLPLPFTPTTKTTWGLRLVSSAKGISTGMSSSAMASANASSYFASD